MTFERWIIGALFTVITIGAGWLFTVASDSQRRMNVEIGKLAEETTDNRARILNLEGAVEARAGLVTEARETLSGIEENVRQIAGSIDKIGAVTRAHSAQISDMQTNIEWLEYHWKQNERTPP